MTQKASWLLVIFIPNCVILVSGIKAVAYKGDPTSEESELFFHLGSREPYRRCANLNTTSIVPEGCKANQMWIFVRHATKVFRKMEKLGKKMKKTRDDILKHHAEGRGSLSQEVLAQLKVWKPMKFDKENQPDELSPSGHYESVQLGKRWKKRVPKLFAKKFNRKSYALRTNREQRVIDTMDSFAKGMFGDKVKIKYLKGEKSDPIVKFYKNCTKYKNEVSSNPATFAEELKFVNSDHMAKAQLDVQQRLGYETSLSSGDLNNLYMMCAYETTLLIEGMSIWCNVFSVESIKAMEYTQDLSNYWEDGYGFEITYKHACYPIKHMVNNFRTARNSAAKKSSDVPKAFISFGHSGGFTKIVAALGLVKDVSHLRADNYPELQNRKWITSNFLCQASNIAFLQYSCGGEFKFSLLLNEKLLEMPFCKDGSYCTLNEFETSFGRLADECRYPEICYE